MYVNKEKLNEFKSKIGEYGCNFVEELQNYRDLFYALEEENVWLGEKSKNYFESVHEFWDKKGYSRDTSGGVCETLMNEIASLQAYINSVVASVTETDENVSNSF